MNTLHTLNKEITRVEYCSIRKAIVLYVKINGVEIAFSQVKRDLGDMAFLPKDLNKLTAMTGITWDDICRGKQYVH